MRKRYPALEERVGRLIFAIHLHGAAVAFEDENRAFWRSLFRFYPSAWWQISAAVRDRGGGPHRKGCACWWCVEDLFLDAARSAAWRRAHG